MVQLIIVIESWSSINNFQYLLVLLNYLINYDNKNLGMEFISKVKLIIHISKKGSHSPCHVFSTSEKENDHVALDKSENTIINATCLYDASSSTPKRNSLPQSQFNSRSTPLAQINSTPTDISASQSQFNSLLGLFK